MSFHATKRSSWSVSSSRLSTSARTSPALTARPGATATRVTRPGSCAVTYPWFRHGAVRVA